MNRKLTTVLLLIALVFVLAVATVSYKKLSADYIQEQPGVVETASPNTAELAADFTVYDGEGSEVRLSDYFGMPIVVNFWATWCGPCKSELPHFDALCAEYGDSVQFLMVNLTDGSRETVEGVKEFVSEAGYSFPVFFDTEFDAVIAYGVQSIPKTVFIHADGSSAAEYIGTMDEDTLRRYIESIIE